MRERVCAVALSGSFLVPRESDVSHLPTSQLRYITPQTTQQHSQDALPRRYPHCHPGRWPPGLPLDPIADVLALPLSRGPLLQPALQPQEEGFPSPVLGLLHHWILPPLRHRRLANLQAPNVNCDPIWSCRCGLVNNDGEVEFGPGLRGAGTGMDTTIDIVSNRVSLGLQSVARLGLPERPPFRDHLDGVVAENPIKCGVDVSRICGLVVSKTILEA